MAPSRLSRSRFTLKPAEVCDSRSNPFCSEYATYGEVGHAASASSSAARTFVWLL